MPRARRVYHAVLVRKLLSDGALTIRGLTGRLIWFHLDFNEVEVRQIVTSAAAHGAVESLTTVNGQQAWAPTELGRKLAEPRGAALEDLLSFSGSALASVQQALRDWWAVVVGALAIGGVGIANDNSLLGAIAAFVFLTLLVSQGVRGERDMKAAAECWPRLKEQRTERWRWQTLPGRPEAVAVWILATFGLLSAAWAISGSSPWQGRCLIAAGAAGLVGMVLYRLRLVPLANAWRSRADIPSKSQQRIRRVRHAIAKPLPVLRWLIRGVRT